MAHPSIRDDPTPVVLPERRSKMTNRRILARRAVVAIVTLLLLPSLSACGEASETEPEQTTETLDIKSLEAAARDEGNLTWYTSSYTKTDAEGLAKDFENRYGIKVEVFRSQNGPVAQRFGTEEKAKHNVADVITISQESAYQGFKEDGFLARYTPLNVKNLLPEFQENESDGYYYPVTVGDMVILYNTDKLGPDEAPESWASLLDERWNGEIAAASPLSSGYAVAWAARMITDINPAYIKDLATQDVLVSQSTIDVLSSVASGNRLIGVTAGAVVRQGAAKGDPISVVYPTDKAVYFTTPMAISRAAPHPNAARLFENYLYTDAAQELYSTYGLLALTEGAPPPAGGKTPPISEMARVTLQDLVENTEKVTTQWRKGFGA